MTPGSKLKELLYGKKNQKQRVNLYVGTEIYEQFQSICDARGLSASETVDALVSDFVRLLEREGT